MRYILEQESQVQQARQTHSGGRVPSQIQNFESDDDANFVSLSASLRLNQQAVRLCGQFSGLSYQL